jgi:hypothetical protein
LSREHAPDLVVTCDPLRQARVLRCTILQARRDRVEHTGLPVELQHAQHGPNPGLRLGVVVAQDLVVAVRGVPDLVRPLRRELHLEQGAVGRPERGVHAVEAVAGPPEVVDLPLELVAGRGQLVDDRVQRGPVVDPVRELDREAHRVVHGGRELLRPTYLTFGQILALQRLPALGPVLRIPQRE